MKNLYTLCALLLVSSALHGMDQDQELKRSRSNSQIITKKEWIEEWGREELKSRHYNVYNQKIELQNLYSQQIELQSLNKSLLEIDKAYDGAEKLIGKCNQLMDQCRTVEQHYIDKANAPCLEFKKYLSITGKLCVTVGTVLYLGTTALILHNDYCMQNGLSNPLHQSLCGS
jgi:hypothetical protein